MKVIHLVKKYAAFMLPEGSPMYSQKPDTEPYPDHLFLSQPFSYYLPINARSESSLIL